MENARILADKNASFILETARFTPSNLAHEILRLIENPQILEKMEKTSGNSIPQIRTAATTIATEISKELK
jgi:UDP-N-acetylglucosamine:LPS N-acetylglucosamine transferase